jgi:hypothetical protein
MVFGAYGFFVVKDKIKVLDKLVKESESVLAVTKTHSKNAKKLANPEVKLTKKTEQEVKKSGTKLQKLMLKIRQEETTD